MYLKPNFAQMRAVCNSPYFDPKLCGVPADINNPKTLAFLQTALRAKDHVVFSRDFSADAYLSVYPDVHDYGLHPLIHYIAYGKKEGRVAFPDFPAQADSPQAPGGFWYETHSAEINGAPLALADVLDGLRGYINRQFVIGCPVRGPLAAEYEKNGTFVAHGISHLRITDAQTEQSFHRQAVTLLKRSRVDTIQVNTCLSYLWVLAARDLNLRVIWVIHEPDPQPIIDQVNPVVAQGIARAFQQADQIVFVSEASRAAWSDQFNSARRQSCVIEKTLKPAKHASQASLRKAKALSDDEILVLSVGTVSARKGQKDLTQALMRLIEKPFAPLLKVVIAGFDQSTYAQAVLRDVEVLRQKGLNITCLPLSVTPAHRASVMQYFGAADVFVMSSRSESLPRTTSEAFAAHCPVISTNVEGIGEMIADGQTGFLYQPGDHIALADRLEQMCANADLRAHMRANLSERTENVVAFDKMIARYMDIYQKLGKTL